MFSDYFPVELLILKNHTWKWKNLRHNLVAIALLKKKNFLSLASKTYRGSIGNIFPGFSQLLPMLLE